MSLSKCKVDCQSFDHSSDEIKVRQWFEIEGLMTMQDYVKRLSLMPAHNFQAPQSHRSRHIRELMILLCFMCDQRNLTLIVDTGLQNKLADLYQKFIRSADQFNKIHMFLFGRIDLVTWNSSDITLSLGISANIYEHFRRMVNHHPDRLCLRKSPSYLLTYKQCLLLVDHLSFVLQHQSRVTTGTRIGLYMTNSFEYIVSILAILKLKGIFLPLDRTHPIQRLKEIEQQSDIEIILTNCPKPKVIFVRSVFFAPVINIRIMDDGNMSIGQVNTAPSLKMNDRSEGGYIIYTSGSTGQPKGILIEEFSLYNMIIAQIDIFNIRHYDTVAQFASICFDASLSEIFMSLLSGASLFIFNSQKQRIGPKFVRILNRHRITVLTLPPSLLSSLNASLLPNLRILVSAGEPCPKTLGFQWLCTNRRFFNAYGPSEAAVCTTIYELVSKEASEIDDCETIPIGVPIHGMQIRVIDSHLQDVPKGTPGELLIGGVGVSNYGYLDRTLIDRSFIISKGKRWYRTGDLVKTHSSNQELLIHLGRIDNQIKLNGCRIELHEIETMVLRSQNILYCVVILHHCAKCSNQTGILVAYFDGYMTEASVRKFLAQHLPTYMLPAYIVKRSASVLPTTVSGKIDRNALRHDQSIHEQNVNLNALTISEIYLLSLWRRIIDKQTNIKLENTTNQITFVQCGGNSLTFALLHTSIRKLCSSDISIDMHMSLQEMSKFIFQRNFVKQRDSYKIIYQDLMNKVESLTLPFRIRQEKNISSILMTGVTGFVGCFLLNEFLRTTSLNIAVLIRAETTYEADHRLNAAFQRYGLLSNSDCCHKRITYWLCGNLSDEHPDFSRFNLYCPWETIDAVIHCAADTNFNAKYEHLRRVNVVFTQYLINQCIQRGISLYYISSLSIFLFPDSNRYQSSSSLQITETDEPHLESIIGGYGQSKYVADSLVLSSLKRGLPGGIFRLGRITGSSLSGIGTRNDLFALMLRGCYQLGAYPNLKFPFDLTPVDHVCRVIVNMIIRPKTSIHPAPLIVHLINTQTMPFDHQFTLLNQFNWSACKLVALPYDQWCNRLEQHISNELTESKTCNVLLSLLPFLRSSLWHQVHKWPTFMRTMHDEAVIDMDPIVLFSRYCIYWKSSGYFV